jgi:DNA-3-methyladenine glycosylase II
MWENAEEFLLKDRCIGPLVLKYGPCLIKPRPKKLYFEDLVDLIVQQQLSMKAAASIFNRIKEKISDNKTMKASAKHKWRAQETIKVEVDPVKILNLKDDELRYCGLSRAKVVYVKDLSEKVLNKTIRLKDMDKLSDDEIAIELTKVKGIGIWTAQMFLMFTLARPDIFPVGDLGLRNAFKKVTIKDLENKDIEKFAIRWKPFRTVASWYIWQSLEN